jgi:hypothetical protein
MEELEGSRIDESRDSAASTLDNSTNIESKLEQKQEEDLRKDTGKLVKEEEMVSIESFNHH